MKKEGVIIAIILLAGLFASLLITGCSASILLGNNSNIRTDYGLGENIEGWLNISLSNEYSNSNLSSSLGGNARIIDLLTNPICNPVNCNDTYSSSNSAETKSFSLSSGQKKLLSLVLSGSVTGITSIGFAINAQNSGSCVNPLKIDLLDDGSYLSIRNVADDFSCVIGTGKGCFDENSGTDEVFIGSTPYCEKIQLIDSLKFKLGAWVKKTENANSDDNLQMILFNTDNEELASCNLPSPDTSGGEISCIVNYSNNEKQDFYVCIQAKNEAVTKYVLEKQTEDNNSCGFYGEPGSQQEYHDYYIFASSAKFSSIGTFIVNQSIYEDLIEDAENYLDEKYNNCTGKCILPLLFSAYGNVNVNVNGLNLVYQTGAGLVNEKKFYDASKQAAKINSGFVLADLSKMNISLNSEGNFDLKLYYNNEEILTKNITVGNLAIVKKITPNIVSAGVNTKFTAEIDSAGKNITGYYWNFGDNSNEETTTSNYATHTYSSTGSYQIRVDIEDSDGARTGKTFTIIAGSPKEVVNSTIEEYKKRTSNISIKLASYPAWYKGMIESEINLTAINNQLASLKNDFNSASSDDDYVDIINELNKLDVPYSIEEDEGSIPFLVDYNKINLADLKTLGAGSYNEKENWEKAIAYWTDKNLDMHLDFKYISAFYQDRVEQLAGIFKLKISSSIDKKIYFVVENPDVIFKDNTAAALADGAGVSFSSIPSEIDFAVKQASLNDINIYLSPEFKELEFSKVDVCNLNNICEQGENWLNCREDCKPWGKAVLYIIIVIVLGIASYFFLQWWYTVKYESHLFKNRNDIYNIINFIKNAKNQGIEEGEIKSKLKKSGWTSEQLSYIYKKIEGKAIMPFDFLKLFKK